MTIGTYRVRTLKPMSPEKREPRNRGRINIRVDPEQAARLRAAGDVNGETLTGFLLGAAAQRAEEVLERAGRIAVNDAAFERFVAALDAARGDDAHGRTPRGRAEPDPDSVSPEALRPVPLRGGRALGYPSRVIRLSRRPAVPARTASGLGPIRRSG